MAATSPDRTAATASKRSRLIRRPTALTPPHVGDPGGHDTREGGQDRRQLRTGVESAWSG